MCAPHPNTLLVANSIQRTNEDTEEQCCARCSNNPGCDVWAYCATDEKDRWAGRQGCQRGSPEARTWRGMLPFLI